MQSQQKANYISVQQRILVIDNDFDICSQIKNTLEATDNNFSVEIAANVSQADEMAMRLKPDIILIDIKPNTEHDLAPLSRLKTYNPDMDYVVLVSQMQVDDLQKKYPDFSAEYIYKPLDLNKLEKTIELLLSRQSLKREKDLTQCKYDVLFNQNKNIIFTLSDNGTILDVNEASLQFGNVSRDEIKQQPLWFSPWARHSPEFSNKLHELFQSRLEHTTEFETTLNDNICEKKQFHFTLKKIAQTNDSKAEYLLEGHDVTEQRMAEQKIRQLSYIDHLTGLSNHAWFFQTVTRSLTNAERHGRCCAILSISLDDFDSFNRAYGAYAGDNMLVEISRRLNSCIRQGDIASRRSGDSFTILLDEISDEEDAGLVAHRINKTVAYHSPLDQQHPPVSASIGVAIYPENGKDARSLITMADQTLLRTKKVDRGSFRFTYEVEDSIW